MTKTCQHCDTRPAVWQVGATEASSPYVCCDHCIASASEWATIERLPETETETVERVAVIYATADRIRPYLPDNYSAIASYTRGDGSQGTVISGRDVAGWTLDGYVLPRLASGLYFGEEIRS